MKVLLVGRNGQVGWELARLLPGVGELHALYRHDLDLSDLDEVLRVVRESRPEIIINAAAYTAVDKAEVEPELAARVNAEAPGVMAEEAKRQGALLVHYSTDYVFDGSNARPYLEDDAPAPINVYGRTKLAGERLIQESGCRHLILRTSWVYGTRGNNFYLTIARKAAKSERLRVVDDQRGVPTTSAFLAEKTIDLIASDAGGILHLVPSGETTWFGFAREIVRLSGSQSDVLPIKSDEFPSAARRPSNSVLNNRRACQILGTPFPDWRELLCNL